MSIKTYIAESEKQYKLRLKSIIPLEDAAMDRIERAVMKFQPLAISRPKKTILQRTPLDFPNIFAAEVWIVDVIFGLPASAPVVREDIRKALNAPESYIVVRNQDEALELETMRLAAIADIELEAAKRGLVPAALLSRDPSFPEGTETDAELFGDAYNTGFLAYVGAVEAERHAEQERKDRAAFRWLDIPDRPEPDVTADPNAFNADVRGAPKIGPAASDARGIKLPVTLALGSIDAGAGTVVKRVYLDANGNRIVLSRNLGENP